MDDYNKHRTYQLISHQDSLFWLGDRFYKVEARRHSYSGESTIEFTSKCPCCDDTRKVNVIGNDGSKYEAECPVCKGTAMKGYGNRITLKNWEVHEYIVYKLSAEGPTTISAYKSGTVYIESIFLKAFCKLGRCMDEYITADVPSNKDYIDPIINKADMKYLAEYRAANYIFRNKKDADKVCAMLKDYDKERLESFNKVYQTKHEYPFH